MIEESMEEKPLTDYQKLQAQRDHVTRMLDPDNPLLERFQKALKEHLLRQIDHLKEDLFEFDCGTKKNNAKREQLGVLVYEEQQIVSKQQTTLEQYIDQLQSVQSAKEEVENVIQEKIIVHRSHRDKMLKAEAKELELQTEVESMNLLITQIGQWENDLESDITIKKRMYEKTKKDKNKLIEDKRFQDAFIYKLMTRIWNLERELDQMDVQLKVKEQEREEMAQTCALGNTNIEALESEYRCLLHSWNSVIVAIGNRDKVLTCLTNEFTKMEEKFKSVICEIEQVKKLSQKEMKKNEELTIVKQRFLADGQNCRVAIENELERRNNVQKKMNEMHAMVEQTEVDLQKIRDESKDSVNCLAVLQKEYKNVELQKGELEEKIVHELDSHVSSGKIATSLKRVLRMLKTKNREVEISLATLENKTTGILSDVESQKFNNSEGLRLLNELEAKIAELGREADKYQEQIKKMDILVGKRQREVDLLNMKYQKMIERSSEVFTSPLETKILSLEKNVEEVQEQNKKLQQFWLREQTNLLRLSEQRQEQIQNNNLLRKQILILEQKNLKITDELEVQRKQFDQVTRHIDVLHNRLTLWGDSYCKKKGYRTDLDKDNDVLKQDFINKLKDAELDCLRLQDEIAQIEEEKVNLSKDLIDYNRQALEWEKKLISAKETKGTMIEEKGKGGEISSMKAEIHRMNVRYSQLRKAQEVLVKDLEHCVSRRDAIITVAEAREKRSKGGMDKTRHNFAKKMDDIRNKTRQMENELEDLAEKVVLIDKQRKDVDDQIKQMEYDIEATKQRSAEIENDIEESKTMRQMNLELLLQLQKKLHVYVEVSKGRAPNLTYRRESSLANEYTRQKEVNTKLSKVLDNLSCDFPNLRHELNRMLNTLKLPVFITMSRR